jgi:predicted ABC-type transport system involved in lysophospholipase L1 biosynthesis ATPase subunit
LQRSGAGERLQHTYDIFEGTEQIQQLVIARAISGLRIE